MRKVFSAEEQLLIATLKYLATDNSYEDLKFTTAISPQLLGRIARTISETCTAIYESLVEDYIMKVCYTLILNII